MAHIDPPPGFNRYADRGLLDSIAAGALDDDYYEVRPGNSSRSRGLGTLASASAVMLLALMVTVAVMQNRSDQPLNELDRDALISDIGARKQDLTANRASAVKLRSEVTELQQRSEGAGREFAILRQNAAAVPVSGPGVKITVSTGSADDVIEKADLLVLLNGLWYAGAEAVAVNGNRLSSLSAVGLSGQSLTVNYRSLTQPYIIEALGNKDQLKERIQTNVAGKYWAKRLKNSALNLDVDAQNSMSLPAAPIKRTTVRHAEVIEGES